MGKPFQNVRIAALFAGFVASAYGSGIYLIGTIAPTMRDELQLTPQMLGLATGLAQIGLMAGAMAAGVLSPIFGPFRLVLASQAIVSVCLALVAICRDPLELIALLTVLGFAAGAIWVPMVPIVQQTVAIPNQGSVLGVAASGTAYGVAINGLLAPPIIAAAGWRPLWAILAAVSFAILALACVMLPFSKMDAAGRRIPDETRPKRSFGILRERVALLTIVVTMVNGLAFLPFQTYLTLLFYDYHKWTADQSALLWSMIGFGGVIGGLAFGMLADRIGSKMALTIAYIALFVACSAIVGIDSLMPTYVATFMFGIAYNAIFGLMASYIARTTDAAGAVLLTGLTFVALGLGSALGNSISGAVIGAGSGGYMIVYIAICVLICLNVVLSLALKSVEAPRASSTESSG